MCSCTCTLTCMTNPHCLCYGQSTGQSLESIGNPAVAQARMSTVVNHTSSTARVQGATPPATVRSTPTTPSPTSTIPNAQVSCWNLCYILFTYFLICCIIFFCKFSSLMFTVLYLVFKKATPLVFCFLLSSWFNVLLFWLSDETSCTLTQDSFPASGRNIQETATSAHSQTIS